MQLTKKELMIESKKLELFPMKKTRNKKNIGLLFSYIV